MTGIPTQIKDFNVYNDADKLIGVTGEVKLPDFDAITDKISGAGILGEIEDPSVGQYGSQEIEIPFRTMSVEMFKLFTPTKTAKLTLRGAIQVSGNDSIEYQQLRIVVCGRPKKVTGGTVKAGSAMSSGVTLEVTYFLIEIAGTAVLELDKLNSVFKVNGIDLLADVRSMC